MFDYAMLLRRYRGNYGISQEQLAEQLGVTPATISRIENRKQQPSAPLMRRILVSCRRPEVEGVIMQLAAVVRAAETYLILIDERIVIAASLGACGGDREEQRRVEGVEFRRLFVPTTLTLLEQAEAHGGLWGGRVQQIRAAWPSILGGVYKGTLTPLNLDGGRYALIEGRQCDATGPYAEIVCLPT